MYIHFCGNGCLGFRPDGGSLLRSAKVSKTLHAPPLGASPRLGIHAGLPTARYLRSASVVNGALRSTTITRRPNSRPGSWWGRVSSVGAGLLAKAVSQSMKMLDGPASSRASPLPQGVCVGYEFCVHWRLNVGASLLAMVVAQWHGCWACWPYREQARSHRRHAVSSRIRSALRPPRGGR